MRKIIIYGCFVITSILVGSVATYAEVTTAAVSKASLINDVKSGLKAVEAKLADLDNRLKDIEAKNAVIDNRLQAIEAKSVEVDSHLKPVEAQISQFSGRINSIEQNVGQLKQHGLAEKLQPLQQLLDIFGLKLNVISLFVFLVLGMVVLFPLILLDFLFRDHGKHSCIDKAVESEFNAMENQEGIAAKLNLAHAYIDMGKTTEAQNLLNEVLANGDPTEQTEAKELLERMKTS
jgi:FimV-like protein